MIDKLVEEILEKNISMRGLIDFGSYSCVGIPYEDALKAMQAYHEAKMKEVTDEDDLDMGDLGWPYDGSDDRER
jgi:hypothetical protein